MSVGSPCRAQDKTIRCDPWSSSRSSLEMQSRNPRRFSMRKWTQIAAAATICLASAAQADAGILDLFRSNNSHHGSTSYGCCAPAPQPKCAAPEPSCAAPAPKCCAPQPTCAAPEPSCAAPEPACHAPEPSCAAPAPKCHAPAPVCHHDCRRCGCKRKKHDLFNGLFKRRGGHRHGRCGCGGGRRWSLFN